MKLDYVSPDIELLPLDDILTASPNEGIPDTDWDEDEMEGGSDWN